MHNKAITVTLICLFFSDSDHNSRLLTRYLAATSEHQLESAVKCRP